MKIALTVGLGLVLAMAAGCAGIRGEGPGTVSPEPKVGEITHVPTRTTVDFKGMMDVVSAARLICLGETHNNVHAHQVEIEVIRELARRFPGGIAIGMEMFREPQQAALDRWTRGELSESDFRQEADWAGNWGFGYPLYREILDFAKEQRIDIIALNPSKELQRAVSGMGLDKLPPEEKSKLPEIGEPDPYQKEVLKAIFGGHVSNEKAFDSFYRVQMLWEETMAQKVADYLASPRGAGKKMVTITGGWHVQYGFGIPKKVFRRIPLAYSVVIPREIDLPEGQEKEVTMDVDIPDIPLPPADFFWNVKYELPEEGQRMGVQISQGEKSVTVVAVVEDSPAWKAGLHKGDVILSLDGHQVTRQADLYAVLDTKRPGDAVSVVVSREGGEKTIEVKFPEKKKAPKK